MELKKDSLLKIEDLTLSFRMYESGTKQKDLRVINGLSLEVYRGELIAVVGASGSGKSLLVAAVLGILPNNATLNGTMTYKGKALTTERVQKLRGTEIAFVPQSVSYLDPLMKVGKQVDGHRMTEKTVKRQSIFKRLGLPEKTEQLYPFQLSGGMTRKALVSTALMTDAELIIADEPTPGMEFEQAIESCKIFRELADEGKTVMLITHDLDLAVEFADRVAVFYEGRIVEVALANDFKLGETKLRHPYSKALWKALPQNGFQAIEVGNSNVT